MLLYYKRLRRVEHAKIAGRGTSSVTANTAFSSITQIAKSSRPSMASTRGVKRAMNQDEPKPGAKSSKSPAVKFADDVRELTRRFGGSDGQPHFVAYLCL
jgi:hypothetical protein